MSPVREMPWAKRVMQFQPSALRPQSECEDHYLRVHSPWAIKTFRDMPEVVGYHTNLAEAQWDIGGGFGRAPDLWRYASMRFRPSGMEFAPSVAAMLAHDHQNFLRDLRRFDVRESVVVDVGGPALCAQKYVIVLDRPDAMTPDRAGTAVDEVVALLAGAFEGAYGARRMTWDRVLFERANAPLREPGQLPVPERVPDSPRLAFIELYFDHAVWGEEFFARPEVMGLLADSALAPDCVTAYRLLERAGHDRRTR